MVSDEHAKIFQDLELYCKALEKRKDWGPIASWRYTQFQELADELTEMTGVSVSYMTLTRIIQKKEFKRSPQLATLNALARYLDYESWDAFSENQVLAPADKELEAAKTIQPKSQFDKKYLVLLGSLILLLILLFIILPLVQGEEQKRSQASEVTLSVINEAPQIPEMLSFKYEVPGPGYYFWLRPSSFKPDAIYQLSPKNKGLKELNPQDSVLLLNIDGTVRPGPYDGLIIKDGQILSRVSFNMGTQGWINMLYIRSRAKNKSGKKRYRPLFTTPILDKEEGLRVSSKIQEDIQNSYMEKKYEVNFFLAKDFGIDANELQFETSLQNTFSDQILNCKYLRITLLTTNGMLEVPLVQTGCNSLLHLWVSEYHGSHANRPMGQYQKESLGLEHVTIKTQNQVASIYWNDVLIDQIPYELKLGELKCIRFKFDGNGVINFVKLSKLDGEEVYAEDFTTGDEQSASD